MKKYLISKNIIGLSLIVLLSVASLLVLNSPKAKNVIAQTSNTNSTKQSKLDVVDTSLDLESTQSGKKIKLTKFLTTKNKLAFDYQFRIEDETLINLLKKYATANENRQFIDIGLFDSTSQTDLYGGVATDSTFKVEGNTFYGSVISTFDEAKIPENAELSLHIYRLFWQDLEELEAKQSNALQDNSVNYFSINNALEYKGDWQFNVRSTPILQTKKLELTNIINLNDVHAERDALQATVSFNTILNDELVPSVAIYKDDVIQNNCINRETVNTKTGEVQVTFNLSDSKQNNSVYKIELFTVSPNNLKNVIGSFQLQNTK